MALMDVRYKIVRNGNGKGRRWELFDLENEQGETTDLAAQQPDHLRKMINHGESQISREISHLSTQITQLSPRLIL